MTTFQNLQAILPAESLDAILLTGEVNRLYASGFHTSAGAVLITGDECLYITDFRYIQAARERVRGCAVLMSTREKPARALVMEKLAALGARRVGFEADSMTVAGLEEWRKDGDLTFVPVQKALHALRERKSDAEMKAVRAAQRIAERALREVIDAVIRPGMTERELCAEIIYRLHKHGADAPSFPPIVVSGPNSALPHGEPGERALQCGDFITMDIGAKKNGYCSDMTRTVALGHADEEMRRVYDTVLQAQLAGIQATRAGLAGREIDAAARAVIEQAGYGAYFGHGFGHGVGLEVHESPSLNPSWEQPVAAGAVVTAEPGIYLPGRFGVRIEDMLCVTPDGCVNLTDMPKQLHIVATT